VQDIAYSYTQQEWQSHLCVPETAYRFVLQDKAIGGALYKYLRHQHKKYRKRYGKNDYCPKSKNCRISITLELTYFLFLCKFPFYRDTIKY
jgi:IS30 family transposase